MKSSSTEVNTISMMLVSRWRISPDQYVGERDRIQRMHDQKQPDDRREYAEGKVIFKGKPVGVVGEAGDEFDDSAAEQNDAGYTCGDFLTGEPQLLFGFAEAPPGRQVPRSRPQSFGSGHFRDSGHQGGYEADLPHTQDSHPQIPQRSRRQG